MKMAECRRIVYKLSKYVKKLLTRRFFLYHNNSTPKTGNLQQSNGNKEKVLSQEMVSFAASVKKQILKTITGPKCRDAGNEAIDISPAVSGRKTLYNGVCIHSVYGNRIGGLNKGSTAHIEPKCKFTTASSNYSSSEFSGGPNPCTFDIVIVGAGIVGTATARELSMRHPTFKLALIEKESEVSLHQSDNNSGVIHAGIYYPPNSKYGRLCVKGCDMMYKYCIDKDIPYQRNGKLIVAVKASECAELANLYRNATTNKVVGIKMVDEEGIKKIEPHCVGLRALHSPHTGVVSYRTVTQHLAEDFQNNGGQIFFDFNVEGFGRNNAGCECSRKTYPLCVYGSGRCLNAKYAVVCAGLFADRLALKMGGKREPMILPVRGKFLQLKPEYTHLVQGNIYPVPQKNNPFPGLHLTHRVDGTVKCGPAAIMATHREGYKWYKVSPRVIAEMVTYGGFYKAPLQFGISAWIELIGALSKTMQIRILRQYIPEIKRHYIMNAPPGVAALGLTRGGVLEKDLIFEVLGDEKTDDVVKRVLHVRSAPSPAATASLAIAEMIADKVQRVFLYKSEKLAKMKAASKTACD